jgi:hypothetical protein
MQSNPKICEIYNDKFNSKFPGDTQNRNFIIESGYKFLRIKLGNYNNGNIEYTYRVKLELQAYKILSDLKLGQTLQSTQFCFDPMLHPVTDKNDFNSDVVCILNRNQGYYSFFIVFKYIPNLITFSTYIENHFLNINDTRLVLNHILKVNKAGIITTNCTPDNILIELENGKTIKYIYTNNVSEYYRFKETGVCEATDVFTMWVILNNFLLIKGKNNLGDLTIPILNDICQEFIKTNYASFKNTPIDSISIVRDSNKFVHEQSKKLEKLKIFGTSVIAGLTIGTIYKKMKIKKL